MHFETNLGTLYRRTRERFRLGGIESPGLEASVILCSAIGKPPQTVHTNPETVVGRREALECDNRVARRLGKEPCAYITGTREFFSRGFAVSPATLIPRPETETVVEMALEKIPPDAAIHAVDAGTGSGCIAITLKKERPGISVTGSDICPDALEKAAENSRLHGAKVNFICGDMLSCFADASADMVVANLPYISEKEFETLPADVRDFEPKRALVSGKDGLVHIKKIVNEAPRIMRPGGVCVVEVGDGQANNCAGFFDRSGFSNISEASDIHGKTRVVAGQWKR